MTSVAKPTLPKKCPELIYQLKDEWFKVLNSLYVIRT